MKIIVFGSKGMAGHMISAFLKQEGHEVKEVCRDGDKYTVDVENPTQLNSFFVSEDMGYDYVINCIGVLGPDANRNPARTVYINSWFPKYLENRYKDTKTKVIHISTDCIFNGERGYYIETDTPNETNIYGRSKALGEINNDKDITFRMSIIGTEVKENNRSGLLNWVINNPEPKLLGWNNCWWNGITTLQLAKCINYYIETNSDLSGIYHLVNNDVYTNKYDLVNLINLEFDLNKTIVQKNGPKDENKILINTKEDYISDLIPTYYQQLKELKNFNLDNVV